MTPDSGTCRARAGAQVQRVVGYMHEFQANRDHAMCHIQNHSSNPAHTASKPVHQEL
jgi:hypothetical protein